MVVTVISIVRVYIFLDVVGLHKIILLVKTIIYQKKVKLLKIVFLKLG